MQYKMQKLCSLALSLGAGLLGLGLRVLLYRTGMDEKNLLTASHPLDLACLALAGGLAAYLALVRLPEGSREKPLYSPLLPGLLAGIFLLAHGLSLLGPLTGLLSTARLVLALAGAVAAALSVCSAASSQAGKLICHACLCTLFSLELLCRYQSWSGNPQLQDYVFHVLACAALVLGTYQRMALGAGLGRPKAHRFYCLMALCLCLLCLAGPEDWLFYLGGGFWALAALEIPVLPEESEKEEENDVFT